MHATQLLYASLIRLSHPPMCESLIYACMRLDIKVTFIMHTWLTSIIRILFQPISYLRSSARLVSSSTLNPIFILNLVKPAAWALLHKLLTVSSGILSHPTEVVYAGYPSLSIPFHFNFPLFFCWYLLSKNINCLLFCERVTSVCEIYKRRYFLWWHVTKELPDWFAFNFPPNIPEGIIDSSCSKVNSTLFWPNPTQLTLID